MLKKYRVLITGSGGMLGIALSRELTKDYEVVGLDIAQSPRLKAQSYIVADIIDRKKIAHILKRVKPHVVIHTAAWTDVDGCEFDKKKAYEINAEATSNVAIACKAEGAILVYISTDFVFDGKKKRPYKESDLPRPLGVYADSKLKGEKAVESLLKKYFILRTSWLYGPSGKNFVNTILEKGREKHVLEVVNDQVGSPTYAKDFAKAIHVLVDRMFQGSGAGFQGSGIYHVTNSGSVSWYEYAKYILKLKKLSTKVIPIKSKVLGRPAVRPAMSVLDNSKFVKFTGHRMRNWKLALKEYLLLKG